MSVAKRRTVIWVAIDGRGISDSFHLCRRHSAVASQSEEKIWRGNPRGQGIPRRLNKTSENVAVTIHNRQRRSSVVAKCVKAGGRPTVFGSAVEWGQRSRLPCTEWSFSKPAM